MEFSKSLPCVLARSILQVRKSSDSWEVFSVDVNVDQNVPLENVISFHNRELDINILWIIQTDASNIDNPIVNISFSLLVQISSLTQQIQLHVESVFVM